jgi:Ca2+-binding EF-hand superfamily protein
VTYYVSERDIEVWKEIFDAFDTDQDGVLAPRDLLEAMSRYDGYHPKRNRIYQTMAIYDKDESGNIDFKEFLRMVFEKPYERDSSEDLKRVFGEIDADSKGFIGEEDLADLASELKENLTQEEIQMIMRKLDPKRTGKISLTAFIDFNREQIV